jgi:hypothetical protein
MLNRYALLFLIAAALLSITSVMIVIGGNGRWPGLILMLAGLGFAFVALSSSDFPASHDEKSVEPALTRADIPLLGIVFFAQLAGLLYMQRFPFHYVQDEFITGYTSYTLPSISSINWFTGYPTPGEWIAGFPVLYYALQRPFIELFGLSLETIRISTWPYHLISAGLVYLIGKELFRCRPWAMVAGIIFVFLAPNLYMAGYGMHNISSTCFFFAALYATIRMMQGDARRWIALAGISTIMAYLTYTSSYLTIPILGLFVLLTSLIQRSWQPWLRFGWVLAIVSIGLSPFLAHALTEHNYFTERGDQVNAVSTILLDSERDSPVGDFTDHLWLNVQGLYTSGIGGVTDYWFGHQSLFDWLTLGLLIAGIGLAIFQGIQQRDPVQLTIVGTVFAVFVFGMLLTLPAGGFHRTSMAFPAIALLITLTLRTVVDTIPQLRERQLLHAGVTGFALTLTLLINMSSLQRMIHPDEDISGLTDSVPITGFIEDQVGPGIDIIISSFPNYHLERELIVRTGDQYDVRIEPFDDAVEHGDSAVIILFQPPPEQIHRLEARFGGGEFVDEWDGHTLDRHLIWVPN